MPILNDAIVKAMLTLEAAEKQFMSYGYHHNEKGAMDKAETNFGYAVQCGDALEHLRLAMEAEPLP